MNSPPTSDIKNLKQRLKKKIETDEIIQQKKTITENPTRNKPEREQKPFERMIRRMITQPKAKQFPERRELPQNNGIPKKQKEDVGADEVEAWEQPEEPKPKPKLVNKNSGSAFLPKESFSLIKDKLKKKYQNPEPINEITQYNEPVLGGRWKMCTEAEGDLRERGRQLDIFERDPDFYIDGHWPDELPRAKPEWCIKKYSRSDAGKEYEKPFSLDTLETTLNYIIDNIMDVDNQRNVPYLTKPGDDKHSFFDIYDFVYDRFRGINKDLTVLKLDTKRQTIQVSFFDAKG